MIFAGREGAERSPREVCHTVTATKGSSETATSAGTDLPSSASSPTIISRTSRGGIGAPAVLVGFDDDAEGVGGHAVLLGVRAAIVPYRHRSPALGARRPVLCRRKIAETPRPRALLRAAKDDEGVYRLHSLT